MSPRGRHRQERHTQTSDPPVERDRSGTPDSPIAEDHSPVPASIDHDRSNRGALLAILAAGALLRFSGLGSRDLWFDEVHTYTDSFFPTGNSASHALFFQITRWVLENGASLGLQRDTLLRLYPAACSMGAVVVVWRLCALLCGRAGALAAAIIVAMAPFQILYAREARFYAPLMFFCAVAWWLAAEIAGGRHRLRWSLAVLIPPALYLAFRMQPTAGPFAAAEVLWFALMVAVSTWGLPALVMRLPAFKSIKRARMITIALLLVGGVVATPTVFAQVEHVVPDFGFSRAKLADFRPRFFWQHILDLGAGIPDGPSAHIAGALFAILATGGAVRLARRQPMWLAASLGTILATFAALLFVPLKLSHQTKYVIYLAVPLLVLAASGVEHLRAYAAMRWEGAKARSFAFLIPAVLAVLQLLPALQMVTREKMAVRPQFEWLNQHAGGNAAIFINGHVGIPAGLYVNTLKPELRSHVGYQRFDDKSSLLKAEEIRSQARAGRETYFVWAWPWDVSESVVRLLKEEADVVAQWPSSRGRDYDSRLYRIRSRPASAKETTTIIPGGQVAGYGRLADVTGIPAAEGASPELLFKGTGRVEYLAELPAGEWMLESDVSSKSPGQVVLGVEIGSSGRWYFGRRMRPGVRETLRVRLTTNAGESAFALSNLLHRPEGDTRNSSQTGVVIHEIRLKQVSPSGDEPDDRMDFHPFRTINAVEKGRSFEGWRVPAKSVEILPSDGDLVARLRLPGKRNAAIMSPRFPVQGGQFLAMRLGARLEDAPGTMMNFRIHFYDATGRAVGNELFLSKYMRHTATWTPYVEALTGPEWADIDVVKRVPTRATQAAISPFVWSTDDEFPGSPNVIHVGPIEVLACPTSPRGG